MCLCVCVHVSGTAAVRFSDHSASDYDYDPLHKGSDLKSILAKSESLRCLVLSVSCVCVCVCVCWPL